MDRYDFKFKWINDQGAETGFFSSKGNLVDETLTLDKLSFPVAVLTNVEVRGKRMVLSTFDDQGQSIHLLLAITKGNAEKLRKQIGVLRSATWAKIRKEQLQKEGRGSEYRDCQCVHCKATIDLTGFDNSPQVFCDFCQRIAPAANVNATNAIATAEKDFRLCDECGMYSKPRKFTIFYFYFLLVIYGFWSKETWRCPGCMRGEAWKMFFGNLPFVLGVPVAVVQLFRSYGAADMGGPFRGLDGANIKARKGKTADAIEAYNKLIVKTPICAGVKHNIGLAFLHDQDIESAVRMFEFALSDCSNYRPSAGSLLECYEKMGEEEKAKKLKQIWNAGGTGEDDPVEKLVSS